EAGGLVDTARRHQHVVGPKRQGAISRFACKLDAFINQLATDAETARRRLDIEQPQFGTRIAVAYQKYTAHHLAIALGDPEPLLVGIEALDERGGNLGDQPLEGRVPAILLRVEHGLAMDDPAEIAAFEAA